VTASSVVIRMCHQLDEMRACVALQQEVWNFSDAELVPLRLFVVAEKVGGQVIGAYQGSDLVGFGVAVPGFRNGHSYLHSHMVGVRKDLRNSGLGRKIKFFQRDEALERGFELVEWTFDPLEIKNSYLNVERLGAIARRYTINQYGITSSPLQGGLPTDRLVAEWWLKSGRVEDVVNGRPRPSFVAQERIGVPGSIYDWKADPALRTHALEVQRKNRDLFLKAFENGLVVLGYERDQQGDGTFLLGRWDEPWKY
jgi:predicted GNAT superfamily acetyltransferase